MALPNLYDASRSRVMVNGEPIPGVRTIEFRQDRAQGQVYALGSEERVGVYHGQLQVLGRIQVASASAGLDQLARTPEAFQLVATLGGAENARKVMFDQCFIHDKSLSMGTGGHAETVYHFTATRMREEDGPAA
jgi:hypothetical protein